MAANLNTNNNQNAEQGTVALAKSFYTLPSGSCNATSSSDGHDVRNAATNLQSASKKSIQSFSILTKTLLPLTSTTRYIKKISIILNVRYLMKSFSFSRSLLKNDPTAINTETNSRVEAACSSTSSSESSIQLKTNQKNNILIESSPIQENRDTLPTPPRQLLQLGVSLSSPNLLNSSVTLTISSSSSESDVKKIQINLISIDRIN